MPENPLDRRLLREAEGYLELVQAPPLGELSAEAGRMLGERCLATLQRLSPPLTRRVPATMMRGYALKLAGRFAEAIGAFEAAGRLDPENTHIHLALGWCHKRSGRLDLAIQALEAGLEVDPREPILYYNLACYWALSRNAKLAARYLSRALDLDENLRELIATEADFDAVRHLAVFQAVTDVIV